jgi:hypothetical protein
MRGARVPEPGRGLEEGEGGWGREPARGAREAGTRAPSSSPRLAPLHRIGDRRC